MIAVVSASVLFGPLADGGWPCQPVCSTCYLPIRKPIGWIAMKFGDLIGFLVNFGDLLTFPQVPLSGQNVNFEHDISQILPKRRFLLTAVSL